MSTHGKPNSESGEYDVPECVQVAVRIKPVFRSEAETPGFIPVLAPSPHDGDSVLYALGDETRQFQFDSVFPEGCTQQEVYDESVDDVVNFFLRGYHCACLVYGQTGTGKTYTMGLLNETDASAPITSATGIVPRALSHVFELLSEVEKSEWRLTMSMVQLYTGAFQDLLEPDTPSSTITIRNHPEKGTYLQNVREVDVDCYEAAVGTLNRALHNRIMAPTWMNLTSSRAHTIIELKFHYKSTYSKLMLVDLAGSERVKKTKSKGQRLEEAKAINTGLHALGNVVAALTNENASHIGYRDSKLTFLLRDQLSGKGLTSMICCLSSSIFQSQETYSTLQFGNRCMGIRSNVQNNFENLGYTDINEANVEIVRLRAEVESLKQRLVESKGGGNAQSPQALSFRRGLFEPAKLPPTVSNMYNSLAKVDAEMRHFLLGKYEKEQRQFESEIQALFLEDDHENAYTPQILTHRPLTQLPRVIEPANIDDFSELFENLKKRLFESEVFAFDQRLRVAQLSLEEEKHRADKVAWHVVLQALLAKTDGAEIQRAEMERIEDYKVPESTPSMVPEISFMEDTLVTPVHGQQKNDFLESPLTPLTIQPSAVPISPLTPFTPPLSPLSPE
ncbi:hypothetical protein PCE1_003872 [Barthelona sp. PCE]